MKKIDNLKEKAEQIYEYEKLLLQPSQVKNVEEIQSKIENIMHSLSIEELIQLDEIINNL